MRTVPPVIFSQRTCRSSHGSTPAGLWISGHLLADPNRLPAVEVAFLNGVDRPTVQKTDADFDRLGVMFRGYIDFGVKEQDPSATRLENVPFAWWRGEVQVAAGA